MLLEWSNECRAGGNKGEHQNGQHLVSPISRYLNQWDGWVPSISSGVDGRVGFTLSWLLRCPGWGDGKKNNIGMCAVFLASMAWAGPHLTAGLGHCNCNPMASPTLPHHRLLPPTSCCYLFSFWAGGFGSARRRAGDGGEEKETLRWMEGVLRYMIASATIITLYHK